VFTEEEWNLTLQTTTVKEGQEEGYRPDYIFLQILNGIAQVRGLVLTKLTVLMMAPHDNIASFHHGVKDHLVYTLVKLGHVAMTVQLEIVDDFGAKVDLVVTFFLTNT
jgi:hypothetical protein